ncbi:MAG: CoA transferase [Nocardioides sp.]|uniref:CaiB/BaiF CoA transferase family protein n=1 Tax=Nocardioides sp. TaxID=35761 RepID=UPI0039E51D28
MPEPQANPTPTSPLPLGGVRVLDLTRALAGPFCTALLGDLGADVVKVESADQGDVVRSWGPFDGTESLYFVAANRNKRSLAVRLWSEEGRALLRRLVRACDVVVENFRPGVLAALGLDEEWLKEQAPQVVVTSISGFGHVGPMRNDPCFDQVAQGMSGFMSLTGTVESGPVRAGVPLADMLSGVFAALGVCAALAARTPGHRVHTSLLESMVGLLIFQAQRQVSLGEVPGPAGNDHPVVSPYGVFATADIPINVAAGTAKQWESLCDLLGHPELIDDPRFARPEGRRTNRDALRELIEEVLRTRPAAEWLAALGEASVPAGPIHDLAGTFADPQVRALGLVEQVAHPALGQVPMIRGPLWIDGEPVHVRASSPMLGQHSREVLRDCGLAAAEVDRLVQSGIVQQWSDPSVADS